MGGWIGQGLITGLIATAVGFWLFNGHHSLAGKIVGTMGFFFLIGMAWDAILTGLGAYASGGPDPRSRVQGVLGLGNVVILLAGVATFFFVILPR